jgi:hypothetical protein
MTRERKSQPPEAVQYPHLQPVHPHQLVQVDIVPRFLPGGACVSCFNAIDVVSRYPTGRPFLTKHSADAAQFLWQVWEDLGIPDYTQVDNESCFSGGFTHPGVLGRVLRLGLWVGTELVFSPIRHPESNGSIERFHQDYLRNVWDKIQLPDFAAVQSYSPRFFEAYRHSQHPEALLGRSPAEVHASHSGRSLPTQVPLPSPLPLTVGKVHFMRRVSPERQVMVLNHWWTVPRAQPGQGVWATLYFTPRGAKLRVYDAAPDALRRTCLVEYPFPLKEPVQPLSPLFQPIAARSKPSLVKATWGWIGKAISFWVSTMS